MKTPFLGSAYVARSVHAADNRMVNLFPEIVPEGGKEPAFLHRAPGLRFYGNVGTGPVRGLWAFKDHLYAVSGSSLYELDGPPGSSNTPGSWSNGPDDCGIVSVTDITGSGTITLDVEGPSAPAVSTFGTVASLGINQPGQTTTDGNGFVYVNDSYNNHVVLKVGPDGTLDQTINPPTGVQLQRGLVYWPDQNKILLSSWNGSTASEGRLQSYDLGTDTYTPVFDGGNIRINHASLCQNGDLLVIDTSGSPATARYYQAAAWQGWSGSGVVGDYLEWSLPVNIYFAAVDPSSPAHLYYAKDFSYGGGVYRVGRVPFSGGGGYLPNPVSGEEYLGTDGNWYPVGNAADPLLVDLNTSLTFDHSGNLYVGVYTRHVIYKVIPGSAPVVWFGVLDTPGTADGDTTTARLTQPYWLSYDAQADAIWFQTDGQQTIRKITNPSGSNPTYRLTVGTESWPDSPAPWSDLVAGSPHAFSLATLAFDSVAPTATAGTYTNSLTGETVTTSGTRVLGPVAGTGPVSMADNGRHLFVAAGGNGYLYDTETETFGLITDDSFQGAGTVGYINGYFVFCEPTGQAIRLSGLSDEIADGSLVILPDVESAEGFPDDVVSLIVDHREVWVFGTSTIEVWTVAPENPDFPLAVIPGAFIEIGCAAPYSVAKLDNAVFWLGQDARGQGIVYRSNGYSGQRISTHAIEWQIQQYEDISDAIAYTYQQDGHSFYVLTFPSADATWVYDVATDAWHERAGFVNGRFTRHRSNCQAFFNAETVVGDCENGNLYTLDLNIYSDNGEPQKWLRSWRALAQGANDFKRSSHHSLQLDCETGVGLVTGQGDEAEVMLRWSDDGGHTWSNEHRASMGKIGQYGRRVIWRRLGMTTKLRDRVYEVSGTDPVKVVLLGAEVVMEGTRG